MITQTAAKRPHDHRSESVVSALVGAGLVAESRRDEAVAVVDRSLAGPTAEGASLRHRLSEVAGYVGGAFLAAAVALFLVDRWETLGTAAQVGLLVGVGGVLAAAALSLGLLAGGVRVLRSDLQPVRRRLAGALLAGTAVVVAIAVSVQVEAWGVSGSVAGLATWATLLVLGVLGYLVAPTLLGQVVVAAGAVGSVPQLLRVLDVREPVSWGGPNAIAFGLLVMAAGAVWLLLAEKALWREVASARVIGCGIALAGAQVPLGSTQASWLAYLLTAVVAAGGFAVYVTRRAWAYLALGVVGLTLVVPEALLDWFDGAMGPAGVLLVAGATLLGASLLGLRLRQEVAGHRAA